MSGVAGLGGVVAYVDDHIEKGVPQALVKAMALLEWKVAPFKNIVSLQEAMRSGEVAPMLLLIDWELETAEDWDGSPHGRSTTNELRDLLREFGLIPVVIVTRFPQRVVNAEELDPRLPFSVLVKPTLVARADEWLATHRSQLESLAASCAGLKDLSAVAIPYVSVSEDLFGPPVTEVRVLPSEQLMSLRLAAYLNLEEWIAEVFRECQAGWVAIVRNGGLLQVGAWGAPFSRTPDAQWVRGLEGETGHSVLVVSRPPRIDEVGLGSSDGPHEDGCWNECAFGDLDTDVYPSMQVEVAGRAVDLHFDTGSVSSFLDFRISGHQGREDEVLWVFSRMSVRGITGPYSYCQAEDDEYSILEGNGISKLRIPFQLVAAWDTVPLALDCRLGRCPDSVEIGLGKYQCGKRSGLIGRDVLRCNDGRRIILDIPSKRVRVEEGQEGRKARRYFRDR